MNRNAFQNVPLHMMPKFMSEHGFNFIRRIVVEQGVR